MRLTPTLIALSAFVAAACLAWLGALWAATVIETRSVEAVTRALSLAGVGWAAAHADGLQLELSGTAPTEAERFRALTVAGGLVDAARLIDAMDVAPSTVLAAPRYSVEILRNSEGISLIGLIPTTADGHRKLLAAVTAAARGAPVADMLDSADHAVPVGWDAAVGFGIAALDLLPRSKISILSDRVAITAIADSAAEKRQMEAALARAKPAGLPVDIAISAPRPVITPFTLRFLIDGDGARFDACSADTPEARARILEAATAAGMTNTADCVLGLGVPSPNWADAVATAIAGVAELGSGSLTFSDADISLIAGPKVEQAAFDRVVGDLNARLPEVFSLSAVMPDKATAAPAIAGPAEFTAVLSDEGLVQLRGRLPDARVRDAVDSFARARFGSDQVYTATRLDPSLPVGWPMRVLSGLEALAELTRGELLVQGGRLDIKGVTGNPEANAAIARILSSRLGSGQDFKIAVVYDKALDPNAGLPTPKECADNVDALVAQRKISFEPGKAEIAVASLPTIKGISRVLQRCGALPFEIGGHTDAQGSAEMNLALSQSRADAVVHALVALGVPSSGLSAQGYGETQPIADNKTDDGREANRRIIFRLLLDDAEAKAVSQATVAADAAPPPVEALAGVVAPSGGAKAAGSGGDAGLARGAGATGAESDGTTPVTDATTADSSGASDADPGPTEPLVVVRPAEENQMRPKPRPPQP